MLNPARSRNSERPLRNQFNHLSEVNYIEVLITVGFRGSSKLGLPPVWGTGKNESPFAATIVQPFSTGFGGTSRHPAKNEGSCVLPAPKGDRSRYGPGHGTPWQTMSDGFRPGDFHLRRTACRRLRPQHSLPGSGGSRTNWKPLLRQFALPERCLSLDATWDVIASSQFDEGNAPNDDH